MVDSVASRCSAASVVPSQERSRAVAVERRYRPRLVGDVRWASAGTGSSWKLSGGSMLSAAVTKVSKNRQVRRAISRSAWASAVDTDMRPAILGDWLVQRATTGEAIHNADSGKASGLVPCADRPCADSS